MLLTSLLLIPLLGILTTVNTPQILEPINIPGLGIDLYIYIIYILPLLFIPLYILNIRSKNIKIDLSFITHRRLNGVRLQYFLYDKLDANGLWLRLLYPNRRDFMFIHEICMYNTNIQSYKDVSGYMIYHSLEIYSLNHNILPPYVTYFTHVPFIQYNGTNGHLIAYLDVPAPYNWVMNLLNILNIRVESGGRSLESIAGNPQLIRVWGTIRNTEGY